MILDDITTSADQAILRNVTGKRKDASAAEQRMNAISPLQVLQRGYSYVTDSNGKALISVTQIQAGSVAIIRMKDGSADAEIKKVRKK
jgi:exodeoxyribonuclease VII large subunit